MTAALAVSLYFSRSHKESDSTGGPSIRSLSFLSPSGSLAAVNRAAAANAGFQSGGAVTLVGHTRARHGTDFFISERSHACNRCNQNEYGCHVTSERAWAPLTFFSACLAASPRGALFKSASRQYLLIDLGYTHVPARYTPHPDFAYLRVRHLQEK